MIDLSVGVILKEKYTLNYIRVFLNDIKYDANLTHTSGKLQFCVFRVLRLFAVLNKNFHLPVKGDGNVYREE